MILVIILNCSSFLILPIDFSGMSMLYNTLRLLCAKLFAMNLSVTQDGEKTSIMDQSRHTNLSSAKVYHLSLLLRKF